MIRAKRHTLLWSVAVIVVGFAAVTGRGWLSSGESGDPVGNVIHVPAPERHDVAVLSVDFDPPLGSASLPGRERALLVAIDNRGAVTETGLTLEVRLAGDSPGVVYTRISDPLGGVSPGEVKVVRVLGGGDLPLEDISWLTVRIRPVQGETNLSNNVKTVRLEYRITGKTD